MFKGLEKFLLEVEIGELILDEERETFRSETMPYGIYGRNGRNKASNDSNLFQELHSQLS
jgi:hypothetical protein